MKLKSNKKKVTNKKNKLFGKIPIIAIIFPPIGFIMLLNYYLKKYNSKEDWMPIAIILIVISVSAWFTHLYVCFTDDRWGFLIAGAIMFPIAIFHGIGTWFGIW